jgi:hypothetical protein
MVGIILLACLFDKHPAVLLKTLFDGVTVGGHRQTDELIATNQIKAWQFLFAAVEEGSFEVG